MFELAKKTRDQLSKDIFPVEAWELMSAHKEGDDLVIMDVSTPKEFKDLHLDGAINVNLFSRFFKTRMDIMDKTKTYVVCCKVGGRSKLAQKMMRHLGFQTVYNIIGGTLLWKEEGLPFAPGTDGVDKFSFCPVLISITTFRKIKKGLQNTLSRIVQRKGIAASAGQES